MSWRIARTCPMQSYQTTVNSDLLMAACCCWFESERQRALQSEMCKFEQFLGSRCVQLHVLKSLKSAMPCQSVGICIFFEFVSTLSPEREANYATILNQQYLCVSRCSKDCSNPRPSPYLCYGNVAGPLHPFAAHVVVSLLPRNIAQHIKRPHSA